MCNTHSRSRISNESRLSLLLGVDPDWYWRYWFEPRSAGAPRRLSALIGFVTAIITTAMRLPADIRRAAGPCSGKGE